MKCPFCANYSIEGESGVTSCPVCSTKFEIDDRGECIFVDTDDPKLPINGTICKGCGLVQDETNEACPYCGVKLDPTHQ